MLLKFCQFDLPFAFCSLLMLYEEKKVKENRSEIKWKLYREILVVKTKRVLVVIRRWGTERTSMLRKTLKLDMQVLIGTRFEAKLRACLGKHGYQLRLPGTRFEAKLCACLGKHGYQLHQTGYV
ncbi:hypothetical protein E1A91_A11G371600v1 [Gossypium mustelinum]|uniref:Uncharacterized protein n=2 Tax=Gossypium TaxID=3633 RepID=A0A5D2XFC9_GOSMU|nr:hypothetical protein ES288_A11G396200v1 [Gossypium darwinii]TYJ12719.1 hypothetical protein E1A91_A11G371600v1 [Gossypium mustelinum]